MTLPGRWVSAHDAALAAIVRSSQDAVIAKSPVGVITSWNDGAAQLYGYSADQVLGRNIELIVPVELRDLERARHATVAAGAAESGFRSLRRCADGVVVEVVMSMSSVRDDLGHVVGVASISRRVNDEERAESRFATLLAAAPDATVCVDTSGRIVLVNEQVTALFGFSRHELIGQPVEVLLPESVRSGHLDLVASFLRDPRPRRMGSVLSLEGQRRDGSVFPAEVSLSGYSSGDDSLAIAAIRDVTQARAVELEHRESELRLRQLAEHIDTVLTLCTTDPATYLYISPAFETVTGYPVEELLANNQLPWDITLAEDQERVRASYREPTRRGLPAVAEWRIRRRDGQVRWIRSISTPVAGSDGQPKRIVATSEDITERVEAGQALLAAESAARAASEAKNDFLSRMSHELRTPLNAVLGFGQLLERRLAGTSDADPVEHILRAGRHLLGLIDEVLDISRIESGELTVSPEPVVVADMVNESALLMRPLADAVQVRLMVADGDVGTFVLADRQRLRQVLLNLLSNAIKYNRPGGAVTLSWARLEGRVVLSVVDDGIGIASGLHHRLFTAFDRLGAERTSVEGTGVGLAVTRGLVELMNGELSFASEAGEGSTFTVVLPEAGDPRAAAVSAPSEAQRSVPVATVAATMLYIEDNEPNVRVMESVLELRPAWRMIHAAQGGLGRDLAVAHKPDLILLDLHLPDSSGADVLAALKAQPATAGIPVAMLSADASGKQRERLLGGGATDYLTKPFDIDVVLALLDRVASTIDRG